MAHSEIVHSLGDIRILSHEPELLRAKLHLSQLVFAQELTDYQQDVKLQTTYPPHHLSLVPNPTTIRLATPEERNHYIGDIQELAQRERKKSDIIVYSDDDAEEFLAQLIQTSILYLGLRHLQLAASQLLRHFQVLLLRKGRI